ncbi:MAG: sodium:calcium antiporter [Anaerolineales bacterium]|jgi:cation:H+ antiporter|nr:sodium:calcium antiporter [Anaerolineales bacterium]
MVWLEFVLSAILIMLAATQLAKYGDVIAVRTGLGGMFIGVVLMAGATSLPEVLTSVSAVWQGTPNLAAGNLLGSNMFNMLLLAILDLLHQNERILRKAALKHALSGSAAVLLITLVVFFLLDELTWHVGWVGIDSILLMLAYLAVVYLIQGEQSALPKIQLKASLPENFPSLRRGLIGFGMAAASLLLLAPWMVDSSNEIAEITGLGATFVGTTLVALVTSLPELVTTIAAAKLGADDMAIGNLFGSNLFNMFALGLTDLFYTDGRFFAAIDPDFMLIAVLGLLMTVMALVGNLARLKRRLFFIEIDAAALVFVYLAGMWLLYTRGAG